MEKESFKIRDIIESMENEKALIIKDSKGRTYAYIKDQLYRLKSLKG